MEHLRCFIPGMQGCSTSAFAVRVTGQRSSGPRAQGRKTEKWRRGKLQVPIAHVILASTSLGFPEADPGASSCLERPCFHQRTCHRISTIASAFLFGRKFTSPRYGRSNMALRGIVRSRPRSRRRLSGHWFSARWPERSGRLRARRAISPTMAMTGIFC